MNKTVTVRNTFTADELAGFRLPGYPTSRKNWYELFAREGWYFVEAPGRGPGGKRKEYIPTPAVMALIQQVQLRQAFNSYREQVGMGDPLATAKANFINDYNARMTTVNAIDGIDVMSLEQLDEALAPKGMIAQAMSRSKTGTSMKMEMSTDDTHNLTAMAAQEPPAPPFDGVRDLLEAVLRVGEYKILHNEVTRPVVEFALKGAPDWLEAARPYPDLELRFRTMISTFEFMAAANKLPD
jgi:hypothetical protein